MSATYHILLVGEKPANGAVAYDRLAGASDAVFDVAHVTTAAEAEPLLAGSALDALVLHLDVSDSRGPGTLRRLKASARQLPILVVARTLNADQRRRLLGWGADHALTEAELDGGLFFASVLYAIERARARAQHRQIERILDAIPDAILVVVASGHVRYTNQSALELFGMSRDELQRETLAFSVRDGEPTEIEVLRRGVTRIGEMRVVPLEWSGEAAHLAAIRDVTDRKHAEELKARSAQLAEENRRIQHADRLKSEFIANMSHELRTPLNAILGFSELLIDGKVDPAAPQYAAFLGHIWTAGKHLLRLIEDALELAKIEAGRIDFHPQPVELAVVVAEVIDIVRPLALNKRVELQSELDPSVREVEVDPVRLRQVLYNYVSNALKFTEEGTVTVRTRAEGPGVFRLEVEDTGVGIARNDIGKLFVEFHQLEAGAAEKHHGTGLGLALTKRMVEAQGGSVGVSSVLGKGSIFYALLPRKAKGP